MIWKHCANDIWIVWPWRAVLVFILFSNIIGFYLDIFQILAHSPCNIVFEGKYRTDSISVCHFRSGHRFVGRRKFSEIFCFKSVSFHSSAISCAKKKETRNERYIGTLIWNLISQQILVCFCLGLKLMPCLHSKTFAVTSERVLYIIYYHEIYISTAFFVGT